MQRRIAEIVTEFRTTGLPAVRDALRAVVQRVDQVRAAAQRSLGNVVRAAAPAAKALGKVALAAAGVGAALAAMAKGSAFAFIHSSVEDTVEDLTQLRQLTALLKMPPELVSYWQRIGEATGLAKEDTTAILVAFQAAVAEAAADPESGFATVFKEMGVQLKGANGQLRTTSHLYGDLIYAQAKLDPAKRGFFLNQLFGGDAAKAAELFQNVAGKSRDQLNSEFAELRDSGDLVTQAQLEAVKAYKGAVSNLTNTFLALKRMVFEQVGPSLTNVFKGLEKVLSKSKKTIADYFGALFQRSYRFALDLAVVFGGIDVNAMFGESNTVVSKWLVDVKALVDAIVALVALAGRALAGALRAANDLVARFTGFNVVDWAKSFSIDDLEMIFRRAVRWVAAFVRDIKRLLTGVWDDRNLETGIAEWIGVALQWIADGVKAIGAMIQGEIDEAVGYLRRAWTEFTTADAAGTGVAGMTTALGVMLISVKDAADAVSKLMLEFKKVFVLGQEADKGFEWIEDLHRLLTRIMRTVNSFMDLMKGLLSPLQSVLDMFGGLDAAAVVLAATIVGKLVAAAFSLVNVMSGGAIGASLTASLQAVGLGFAGLMAPIAAFVAALAVSAAAVVALWNAIPQTWRDGVMDTLGTSETTMNAKFFDLRKENDASLYQYGIKPGALATWQAMNPTVSAPLGGGRFADVAPATPANLQPVDININGQKVAGLYGTVGEIDGARRAASRSFSL